MSMQTEVLSGRQARSYSLIVWAVFISPLLLFLVVTFFVPLLGIFSWSFTDPEPGFANYARIAQDRNIHAIIWRTAWICTVTSVVSVFLAYILAYHWTYGSAVTKKVISVAVLIPFWISVLIRAFGWLALLRPRGLVNEALLGLGVLSEPLVLVRSDLGVIIGMVHFMVPFAIFPLLAVMRQIDVRLLQAARGLGAGSFRRFTEIFFPLTIPGVLGSFFIVFVFSLGFFITPSILGGGRVVMMAEYIFTQMSQTANWGLGAALATMLLLIVVILVWFVSRVVDFQKLVR